MENIEFERLKNDVKSQNIGNFYIFHGEEHYMLNFYAEKIESELIDGAFKSFNLEKFDEFNFDIDEFLNALDSYPAMSERKLIKVTDVDIFKLKTDVKDKLLLALSDLPDYVCLLFIYTSAEYKPDGRSKLGQSIKKNALVVNFEYLSQKELIKWLKRRFKASECQISDENLQYLIFNCGSSMGTLANETTKLCSYTKEVTLEDINLVCTKALEAKIFDVSECILKGEILRALEIIDDLIMLKHEEFSILSVINSQFQRLYFVKCSINANKPQSFIQSTTGLRSNYALNITINQAKSKNTKFLRDATNLCVKALFDLVSKNIDKKQIIENLVVSIGAML